MELFNMLLNGANQAQQPENNQDTLRSGSAYQDLQNQQNQQIQYDQQVPQDDNPIGGLASGGVEQIAGQLGVSPEQAQQIIRMALPLIMGKLGQNTQTDDGANALNNALDQHANRRYQSPADIDPNEGGSILGHIFGNKASEEVAGSIGRQAGVDSGKAFSILKFIAPIALAYLANKKQKEGLDARGVRDITDRYSNEMNEQAGGSLFDALNQLPQDGQESQGQDQSLLGGILGGLFGK